MEAPRTGATTMASTQRRLAAGVSPDRSVVPVAAASHIHRDLEASVGRLDLNQRPLGPQPALGHCSCVRSRPHRPLRPRQVTSSGANSTSGTPGMKPSAIPPTTSRIG